jgi:ribonuclease HII
MTNYEIGIDEVGRGPLAGPVVVAAVALPTNFQLEGPCKLADSKKLTENQRELWSRYIISQIPFSIARVYPITIDRINISQAANLAATRALKRLNLSGKILLDAGLKINTNQPYQSIIKGDEKYDAIALASIIAKVHRDNIMIKNHHLYNRYGFNRHKGYGTQFHLAALKKFGPCPLHRRSFLINLT